MLISSLRSVSIGPAIRYLALLLLITSSCSQPKIPGRPELTKVTGIVRYKNAPVEGARLVFVPQDHKYAATGETDADGRFSLQTYQPNDGAAPGDYRILIKKYYFVGDVEHQLLPVNYGLPEKSELTATVVWNEENVFQFDLKSPR